ncbi:hypothetical protein [Lachnoclostridium phytofermentans]|uniref:Uncharacterized protein n=1 Tax=Lachnoclostridium phytofermentans (strain ATCC 700394 / DSM 18823 / ISDg) TaxID=357809 RepID=A9KM54_LACP7|nr:hypothetical protein [Lachnoclostridium phytofermentans]ABX41397.1 hypothetical protein Cphy_1017 [Lachnoclostridium phytofermentans ISDg]
MKQIIVDSDFKRGFALCHTDGLITKNPIRILNFGGLAEENPVWKIAQWCSQYNLANGTETVLSDASYEYRDSSKYVKTHRGKGVIEFGLNASKEYSHPRAEGEGWPHILLEQEFATDYYCRDLQRLEQAVGFRITKFKNYMKEVEQTDLHTIQFQWFLSIENRNVQSKGYHDFYWFGISYFDYPRYSYPPGFQAQDGGKEENTGKFIYIIPSKSILKKPVIIGEENLIRADTLKEVENAFFVAKERGFLKDSNWEDMCISNMNIGFEVTGTFEVEAVINEIQIIV